MRLEAQKKLGYYPTPDRVVAMIREHLAFPAPGAGEAALLDPCCGDGAALAALAAGRPARTYGIEIDRGRTDGARMRLDHVVEGSYETAVVSPSSMSLLFLNPPYDWEDGRRKEFKALVATDPALRPGGVLVYILPQERLDAKIARFLSDRYSDVRLHRFPDPEFDRFRQIVVFGIRKKRLEPDPGLKTLLVSATGMTLLPLAEEADSKKFLPPGAEVGAFKSESVALEELASMAARSPLHRRLRDLTEPTAAGVIGRPPLPLHRGHLGMLLASGALHGKVGAGADRHVVVGQARKVQTTSTMIEADEEVTRERDSFRITIKVLLPSGEIKVLS